MRSYEGMFIFPPESAPESGKKQLKNLEDLISKFQGSIVEKIDGGKKPLGYPVKKFKEGYFILLDFQLDSLKMMELRNALTLQEDLLKFMITLKNVKAIARAAERSRTLAAKPAHQVGTAQQQ